MARPKAALVVTKVDRQVLDSMAHRARTAPQLARRARIVLACAAGLDNTTVAKKLADVKADGGPLAAAVYRQGRRWAARRTAAGCPSDDQRYAGGSRRNSDVGNDTARRDPLEHAHAGEGHGRQSDECASHLAGFSDCSRIARRASSCRLIRCSSTRSATSWGCISIRRSPPRSSASTKSRRSRPWIARRRCSPCARAKLNGGPTTTTGTGRRRSLPRWK